jgi:hypothetical protein
MGVEVPQQLHLPQYALSVDGVAEGIFDLLNSDFFSCARQKDGTPRGTKGIQSQCNYDIDSIGILWS